jgi:YbbR domain-containing protein
MATPVKITPLQSLGDRNPARPAKRRASIVSRVATFLERNIGLRLISVGLAIALWIFVNAGQHTAPETFVVPVTYRDLPPGFILTNQHPETIRIQVTGPRTLLSIIDPAHLTLRLDLTGVGIGQASFKISPDVFPVPRHTEVTSIVPSQIVLDIDKNITREVPVHLIVSGDAADGYRIAATEVTPARIALRGPSRALAHVDQVDTEPVAAAGITGDLSRNVDLMAPSNTVRLEPDEVTAKITVAEVVTDKEFRQVPINVRDTDLSYRMDPRRVNLVVRGPSLTLAKIDWKTAAYIEAAGFGPGAYNVAVQLNLPDGVALVRQAPEKVRVKMYQEARARKD